MYDEIIREINKLIEQATNDIENSTNMKDYAWYRGFRMGLSAAKDIIEKIEKEDKKRKVMLKPADIKFKTGWWRR